MIIGLGLAVIVGIALAVNWLAGVTLDLLSVAGVERGFVGLLEYLCLESIDWVLGPE